MRSRVSLDFAPMSSSPVRSAGLLVESDRRGENVAASAVPIPRPVIDRSTARRPIRGAGTGSGACFASAIGALDRSMPVMARLTLPTTTTESTPVTTHVAAVFACGSARREIAEPAGLLHVSDPKFRSGFHEEAGVLGTYLPDTRSVDLGADIGVRTLRACRRGVRSLADTIETRVNGLVSPRPATVAERRSRPPRRGPW